MILKNDKVIWGGYFSVVFVSWFSFFGMFFFPLSENLVAYEKTNYWAYAYIASLFFCLFCLFWGVDRCEDKNISRLKLAISLVQVLTFFGMVWGYISLLGLPVSTIGNEKFYIFHYFISSCFFNIIVWLLCRRVLGWISFLYGAISTLLLLLLLVIVL